MLLCRLVCQVAGQLQGRMPGDLGDLGEASLSASSFVKLLDLLDKHKLAAPVLRARVISQAQRIDLYTAEWEEIDNRTDMFKSIVSSQRALDEYFCLERHAPPHVAPHCSSGALAETTYVCRVLQPLVVAGKTDQAGETRQQTEDSCPRWREALDSPSTGQGLLQGRDVVSRLKMICACSILYPLGGCWASNSQNSWYDIPGAEERLEPSKVMGGSFIDLAATVDTVGALLKTCVEMKEGSMVQEWTLRCLSCLAVATGALDVVDAPHRRCVEASWQAVWSSLFRSDLPYLFLTKSTSDNAQSDTILRLLIQLVRFQCAGDSKTFNVHDVIWKLPAFTSFPESPLLFQLVFTVLRVYGLSDTGRDVIGEGAGLRKLPNLGTDRRSRLASYCINFLQHGGAEKRSISLASQCTVALLNYTHPPPLPIFLAEFMNQPVASLFLGIGKDLYPFEEFELFVQSRLPLHVTKEPVEQLWGTVHCGPQRYLRGQTDDFTSATACSVFAELVTREQKCGKAELLKIPLAVDGVLDELGLVRSHAFQNQDQLVWSKLMSVKIYISISIVMGPDAEVFKKVISVVSEILSSFCLSDVTSFHDEDEWNCALGEIILICRSVVAFARRLRVSLMETDFAKVARTMYAMTSGLLKRYKVRGEECADSPARATVLAASEDSNSEDEVSVVSSGRGTKRRKQSDSPSTKKRRTNVVPPSFVTSHSARLVAALMLTLNPSVDDFEVSVKAILGVDDVGSEDINPSDAVDVLDLLHSLHFLSEMPSLSTSPSVPMLLSSIVQKLCSGVEPHSTFYMFGLQSLARFSETMRSFFGATPLESNAAVNIVSAFVVDDRQAQKSLNLRPHLRLAQLNYSHAIFQNSDPGIHIEMDRIFTSTFVLPFLADLNRNTRRSACRGVANAMVNQQSDNNTIAHDVRAKLMPAWGTSSSAYRQWCSAFVSSRKQDEDESTLAEAESNVWNDARNSFQFDISTMYWPCIAANDRGLRQKVLFDIIWQAGEKPQSQLLYFQAIERMAIRSDYGSAEKFIDYESRHLCKRWLELGKSLYDIPLVWYAPSVLRKLLLSGRTTYEELDTVGENFLASFLLRNLNHFVPELLFSSVATTIGGDKEATRALYENEFMQQICVLSVGKFGNKQLINVLSTAYDALVATCAVKQISLDHDVQVVSKVLSLLRTLFPDFAERNKLVNSRVCKVAVEMLGNDISFAEEAIDFGQFMRVLRAVLDRAPCNPVELLVFSRFLLSDCSNEFDAQLRWKILDGLIRYGCEKASLGVMSVYTSCFVKTVDNPKWMFLRDAALDTAIHLSNTIAGRSFAKDFLTSSAGRDLCGCMFDHHVTAQKHVGRLLDRYQCRKLDDLFGSFLFGSGTLPLDEEHNCLLRGESGSSDSLLPKVLRCEVAATSAARTMRKTFHVVKVFLNSGDAHDLQLHPLCCFDEEDSHHTVLVDLLSANDACFAMQHLVDKTRYSEQETNAEFNLATLGALTNGTVLAANLRRIELDLKSGLYEDHRLLRFCLALCSRDNPMTVRTAAARCVGEMKTQALSLSHFADKSTESSLTTESLSSELQLSVIESLVKCLKNENPRKAEIACETIKALSVGETLQSYPRALQDLLYALMESENTSLDILRLSDTETVGMKGEGPNEEWCWASSFWSMGPTTSQSFESWISYVTTAFLDCYFKEPVANKDRILLSKCHRMCLFDANFATTCFPAIIMSLLTDQSLNPPFGEDRTDINKVSLETWVGQPDSPINKRLSAAFTSFLSSALQQDDRNFLNAAVDTVDLLRKLTQAKFLSAPHQKRSGDLPRDYGVYIPFGTVLELDGRLVVRACIAASRYEQALFYAELFADIRFGGSSVCGPLVSAGKDWLTTHISGFGAQQDGVEVNPTDEYADRSIYFKLLAEAFEGLGETESKIAIERARADLDFCDYETDIASATQVTQSFFKLQIQENLLSQHPNARDANASFLESLEELELLNGMEAFVRSLQSTSDQSASNKHDVDVLAEKNEQCRLFKRAWDDSCFVHDRQSRFGAVNQCTRAQGDSNVGGGFFYMINEVLDSITTRSAAPAREYLQNVRIACLDDLSKKGKSNMALLQFSERMHLVNGLSDFSCDLSSTTSLLERFSRRLWATPLSNCIEEATLRVLLASETDGKQFCSLAKSLQEHLEQTFEVELIQGRQKAAHGALKRLSTLYRHLDKTESDCVMERLLSFRLREARLMEKSGDVSGAIASATCATSILHPSMATRLSPGEEAVRVDALTLCGEWTAKYKVEPAATALKKYVGEAKTLAEELWEKNASPENTKRLARALSAQSLLANTLFNGALTKTRSIDWIAAGESLEMRRSKLQQREKNDKILKEGKTQPEKSEITLTTKILRDEVRGTSKARKDLEDKMEEHRVLALKALVASLKLGGCDESDSSKHVYQLVSMLFSCHEEGKWSQDVKEVGTESAAIPSFRFVPLFSQMLSRLDTPSNATSDFQIFLRGLVVRVAAEHPYHCLLPLMALSTQENEKATVASDLLVDIEKRDPKFVGQLLAGYRNLAAAYSHLAMVDVSKLAKGKKIAFSGVCKKDLRLDRCLNKLACPPCILTKPPPIQPDANYGDGTEDPIGGERIASFDASFTIASSGLSRPRIVICVGSKGGRHKQLVKGNDDTRQDAVMEQVFGYVNELLSKPIEGKRPGYRSRQELTLATYNVVPLSRQAGVSCNCSLRCR